MPPTAPVGRPIGLCPITPPPRATLAELCAEARRLAHRRCRAEAAVRRLRAHPAQERVGRLAAHSDRLLIGFHRTLDRIRAAEGFDEALELFREYRAELALRLSRGQGPGGAVEPCPSRPDLDGPPARGAFPGTPPRAAPRHAPRGQSGPGAGDCPRPRSRGSRSPVLAS